MCVCACARALVCAVYFKRSSAGVGVLVSWFAGVLEFVCACVGLCWCLPVCDMRYVICDMRYVICDMCMCACVGVDVMVVVLLLLVRGGDRDYCACVCGGVGINVGVYCVCVCAVVLLSGVGWEGGS